MPLVNLLNVPQTKEEWDIFSFSHRDSHKKIIQAIQAQNTVILSEYELDPINPEDVQGFLNRNQQAHQDMNRALQTQGSDLSEVDLNDPKQLQAWISAHYKEHYDAETELKI